MKDIYIRDNSNTFAVQDTLRKIHLHSELCLDLACYLPTSLRAKAISEWRDSAEPGDIFVINHDIALFCLDFEVPCNPGAYSLAVNSITLKPSGYNQNLG